jgi:hypothetical protein
VYCTASFYETKQMEIACSYGLLQSGGGHGIKVVPHNFLLQSARCSKKLHIPKWQQFLKKATAVMV